MPAVKAIGDTSCDRRPTRRGCGSGHGAGRAITWAQPREPPDDTPSRTATPCRRAGGWPHLRPTILVRDRPGHAAQARREGGTAPRGPPAAGRPWPGRVRPLSPRPASTISDQPARRAGPHQSIACPLLESAAALTISGLSATAPRRPLTFPNTARRRSGPGFDLARAAPVSRRCGGADCVLTARSGRPIRPSTDAAASTSGPGVSLPEKTSGRAE